MDAILFAAVGMRPCITFGLGVSVSGRLVFVRVMHGALLIAAALWNGFGPLHHQRAAFRAEAPGWFCFNRVFASRII